MHLFNFSSYWQIIFLNFCISFTPTSTMKVLIPHSDTWYYHSLQTLQFWWMCIGGSLSNIVEFLSHLCTFFCEIPILALVFFSWILWHFGILQEFIIVVQQIFWVEVFFDISIVTIFYSVRVFPALLMVTWQTVVLNFNTVLIIIVL